MNHVVIGDSYSTYLDVDQDILVLGSYSVPLSRIQVHVLLKMVQNLGSPVTHSELIRAAWGRRVIENQEVRRNLYVLVHRLRDRIESVTNCPKVIVTVKGLGYLFVPDNGWPQKPSL